MLGILVVTVSLSMLLMMMMTTMITCILVLMRLDFMTGGALGLHLTLSQEGVGKASFL